MSAFKTLKDVSASFDEHLQQLSNSLFCARVGECPEEVIAKKLQDLRLFSSKYHLLHAKEAASRPETAERVQTASDVIPKYEQTAQRQVLERCAVKSLVRSRAVQTLLTTADRKLSPELRKRKLKILARLSQLRALQRELGHVDTLLLERQQEGAAVRRQWDSALAELRTKSLAAGRDRPEVVENPLQSKLQTVVDKLELMRQLVARLLTARGGSSYDWLADPQGRAAALRLTRQVYTVEGYTCE